MNNDDITWITVNGVHIPIGAHEDKDEAIKRALAKKNGEVDKALEKKDREISANKADADNRNDQQEQKNEVVNKVSPEKFREALDNARNTRPVEDRWRVDNTHTVEDFQNRGCRCYESKGGSTVAVDKNGDIISVCRARGDRSISGAELLRQGVRLGGTKLDSFYGNNQFYCDNGFQPVCVCKWNDKYAPDGWNANIASREDVVFYRYVGTGRTINPDISMLPTFDGDDGYDRAYAYRDNH